MEYCPIIPLYVGVISRREKKNRRGAYARAIVVNWGCVNFKCATNAGEIIGKQKTPPAHILVNSVDRCQFTSISIG